MNTKQIVAFAIGVAIGVYVVPRILRAVGSVKVAV
jgi:hypothetical protein